MNKRVGIFIYYEWLSIAPSILSTIRYLSEHGYYVDVFHLHDGSLGQFKTESDRVILHTVNSKKWKFLTLIRFLLLCVTGVRKHKYTFFVGVDQEGVIVSGTLGFVKRVPNVYYSLEILTKEDIQKEKGVFKLLLRIRRALEKYFAQRAHSTIVQDMYRADVLKKDLGILQERISLVPNSYDFKPTNGVGVDPGIPFPTDKDIILYAGSLIPDMAIDELVDSVERWPSNTVLWLHTPYKTPYGEDVKKRIKEKGLGERIIVSEKKLSFEELFALFAKARIGISLYRFTNISFELATSGKLSLYLRAGLPVISSRIPYVEELFGKYDCGVCVDSAREVGDAIQKILGDYERYLSKTTTCYEEELSFSKHFAVFMKQYEHSS